MTGRDVDGIIFRSNHASNCFKLKVEDLAGLPDRVVQAAAEMAEARGMEGKWVFTLQKPSFIPGNSEAFLRKT